MSSPAQIRANRANSARSTGPKTEKGRAASSANAMKHGLTSEQLLIGSEIEEDYDALLAGLIASHQPANSAESMLVSQIAESYWRLLRAHRIENGHWEQAMETNRKHYQVISPDRELASIFQSNYQGIFDRLMRYQASIERSYYRAIKQLEHLQLIRRQGEKPIGFVSKKPVTAPETTPPSAQSGIEPTEIDNPVMNHTESDASQLVNQTK